jgi:hypothetical protein
MHSREKTELGKGRFLANNAKNLLQSAQNPIDNSTNK